VLQPCVCTLLIGAHVVQVVELLLVNGANPNLADVKHGWACLHCAVRLKNNAIAKLLIAKGTRGLFVAGLYQQCAY